MAKKLPTPRIQLRWAVSEYPGYQWQCHYELVIRLDKYDVRREVYKNGRLLRKRLPNELAIQMKSPTVRNSTRPPCTSIRGDRFADEPFRDGAHARWDAIQLGDPPIFVIAPDGQAFRIEYDAASLRASR